LIDRLIDWLIEGRIIGNEWCTMSHRLTKDTLFTVVTIIMWMVMMMMMLIKWHWRRCEILVPSDKLVYCFVYYTIFR